MMDKYEFGCLWILAFGLMLGFTFFFAWLFQLLWNFVVPDVFNGPEISYWVAVAFIFLMRIIRTSLFGRKSSIE